MSFIDNIIGAISPKAAFERARYRAAASLLEDQARKFDAAARGRRTSGWQTVDTSMNVLTGTALTALRARSRDLVRNNPYARKAVNVIVTNTVGTGIKPGFQSRSANRVQQYKSAWNSWAESTACDFDGQRDFYGLQAAVLRTVAESGEALIVRRRSRRNVPLELQLLEADYLDSSRDIREKPDGGYIIQGVEFNKAGKRIGYWLYDGHPGEYGFRQSRFVKAADVLHIYEVLRPGQVRGIPFGTSAMLRLKDFDDYEDAELVRQKIAACFAAFVVDADPASSGGTGGSEMIERLEPGIIEHLPAGKTIEFASPPTTQNYDNYSRKILQAIASGYGITYEALTGDLSNVNFSSGRMGWLEMARQIELWQWNMMIPMLCSGVWGWFEDAAGIGLGLNRGDLSVSWTCPRREMIDPLKETNAKIAQVRSGLMSMPEALREQGYEPDQVLAEITEWNGKLDQSGVILDTDPRKTKAEQLKAEPEQASNQVQE